MAKTVSIIGLETIPIVKKGDNLSKLIVDAVTREGVAIDNHDIVIVAQKIVSKAEGRIVRLRDLVPSEKALEIAKVTHKDPRHIELILHETENVVKASEQILIVKGRTGIVCLNAGIDKSNVEGDDAHALLPVDPDKSAQRIRSEIRKLTGKNVAVVICDTFSRPFRRAQVNFAIGMAGLSPFKDYRGQKDLFGYVIKVKRAAVADEIAAAAELVMGQGREAVPVVIMKQLNRVEWTTQKPSAEELLIPKEEDLFAGTL